MTESIVSSEWLYNNLESEDLIILDASQKEGDENIKIKGARIFDIKNDFSDKESVFPNTLPFPKDFESACRKLGINNRSKIVVYDNKGIYSSPRVWWMFKTMGHDNIAVLDGGLPDWNNNGYPTESRVQGEFEKGDFEEDFQSDYIKDFDFVLYNSKDPKALVIDARSAGRFNGTSPEPREGLSSGSIPESINLPYTEVLESGKYKPKTELAAIFNDLQLGESELVFSCGSGITACIIMLAAEMVIPNEKSVYDGSWTEWAQLT